MEVEHWGWGGNFQWKRDESQPESRALNGSVFTIPQILLIGINT